MVGSDVPGRIQVRVEGEAALLAAEVAPAGTVGLLSVPAPAALLAGVAGIDRGNSHAHQRRLVACEPEQAREGPRVQAPTLPLASLHAGTDVGQAAAAASGLFAPPACRGYLWEITYDTAAYLDVLRTYSGHRALDSEGRRRLLDCVADLIERRYGGRIRKAYLTQLMVARRL